jgi:hypothetical protein
MCPVVFEGLHDPVTCLAYDGYVMKAGVFEQGSQGWSICLRERKVKEFPLGRKMVTKNVGEDAPHRGIVGSSDHAGRGVSSARKYAAHLQERMRWIGKKLKAELAHHSIEDVALEGQGMPIRHNCAKPRIPEPPARADKHRLRNISSHDKPGSLYDGQSHLCCLAWSRGEIENSESVGDASSG